MDKSRDKFRDKSLHSLPHYSTNDSPIPRRTSAFDFRGGSDVCPTCGGTGKVPKGQQEELVALIPYKDRRLKPRRTCLIVVIFLLVIVVMLISATLLAVFLSPRNVTFTCSKVLAANWTTIKPPTDEDDFHLTLQVHGMAKNYNYVAITMKSIDVSVNRDKVVVGSSTSSHEVSIGARQHKEIIILVNATYQGTVATKTLMSDVEYNFSRDHACINLPIFVSYKQH